MCRRSLLVGVNPNGFKRDVLLNTEPHRERHRLQRTKYVVSCTSWNIGLVSAATSLSITYDANASLNVRCVIPVGLSQPT